MFIRLLILATVQSERISISQLEYDPTCQLKVSLDGYEIEEGSYVTVYPGSDVHLYCNAFCTGSGVSPSLEWLKNDVPLSGDVGRYL